MEEYFTHIINNNLADVENLRKVLSILECTIPFVQEAGMVLLPQCNSIALW